MIQTNPIDARGRRWEGARFKEPRYGTGGGSGGETRQNVKGNTGNGRGSGEAEW